MSGENRCKEACKEKSDKVLDPIAEFPESVLQARLRAPIEFSRGAPDVGNVDPLIARPPGCVIHADFLLKQSLDSRACTDRLCPLSSRKANGNPAALSRRYQADDPDRNRASSDTDHTALASGTSPAEIKSHGVASTFARAGHEFDHESTVSDRFPDKVSRQFDVAMPRTDATSPTPNAEK